MDDGVDGKGKGLGVVAHLDALVKREKGRRKRRERGKKEVPSAGARGNYTTTTEEQGTGPRCEVKREGWKLPRDRAVSEVEGEPDVGCVKAGKSDGTCLPGWYRSRRRLQMRRARYGKADN